MFCKEILQYDRAFVTIFNKAHSKILQVFTLVNLLAKYHALS